MKLVGEALYKLRDTFRFKNRDYKTTFNSRAGQNVLIDLACYCRANVTTFHADPRIHARLEGRRDVWNKLQEHLHLSPDQMMQLYQQNPAWSIDGDDNA